MRKNRILTLLVLTLWFRVSGAETIHMTCVGTTTGKNISPTPKTFDMQVETSPPDIIGRYLDLNWCMSVNPKQATNSFCEISATALICRCSGGDVIFTSSHILSRMTGLLKIVSTVDGDVWFGEFKCSRIQKRVF